MPDAHKSGLDTAHLLLCVLSDASTVRALTEDDWNVLIQVARSARLLGVLGARVEAGQMMPIVPPAVRAQLQSEQAAMAYRTRMVWWELDRLARTLGPLRVPIVLLKGAAYLIQGLRCAQLRSLSDVDVLVPRDRLSEVEEALLSHGWEAKDLEPYDDRYYRQWSHELPPFRYGGGFLELDVHHALLPPLGRIRPDPTTLFGHAVAIPDTPFRTLAPEDQVLHAALHLLQDSDCTNRLREIVDIDALIQEFSQRAGFWDELLEHAAEHGAGRPLWYALRFARRLLQTQVPEQIQHRLDAYVPRLIVRWFMDVLVSTAVVPPDPDRGYPRAARVASLLLLWRSVWLRFPPRLFLVHSITKAIPRLRSQAARPQPM